MCPSKGHQHGVSMQSLINLGKAFFRISRVGMFAQTWLLARLLVYLSSFISQIWTFCIDWFAFLFLTAWQWKHRIGEKIDCKKTVFLLSLRFILSLQSAFCVLYLVYIFVQSVFCVDRTSAWPSHNGIFSIKIVVSVSGTTQWRCTIVWFVRWICLYFK